MHRAFWAIQRNMSTSRGEQTNAVFGVTSMLLTILKREHPDAIIACFDDGSETFRHEAHDAYKAGRKETPDGFYTQIPKVKECLRAFAIPILSDRKYEADDLIGTLAVKGAAEGYEVIIVTGDKDLFQMADTNICISVPHKGYSAPEYIDANGVKEKLGVTPDQVPDYKGLMGDSSDNIKGVKGIGPKTAAKLIQAYGTIDELYKHIEEVEGGVRAKLENDRESAFFSRKLAIIIKDVQLNINIEDVLGIKANLEDIEKFFAEIEFYTLRARLNKMLNEDEFSRSFFSGEMKGAGREYEKSDIVENRANLMTEEQLPLLD